MAVYTGSRGHLSASTGFIRVVSTRHRYRVNGLYQIRVTENCRNADIFGQNRVSVKWYANLCET